MGMCGRAVGDDVVVYTMLVEGIVELWCKELGELLEEICILVWRVRT